MTHTKSTLGPWMNVVALRLDQAKTKRTLADVVVGGACCLTSPRPERPLWCQTNSERCKKNTTFNRHENSIITRVDQLIGQCVGKKRF